MTQPAEQLPPELEDEILSRIPTTSFGRFRTVCKRWNALFNEKYFVKNHLDRARPQFILIAKSKTCLVDVNLESPSIEVHNLPQFIPGYRFQLVGTLEYRDGLVIFATPQGIGICNPWLRQIRWIKSKVHCRYEGIGDDNSKPDSFYKLFMSYPYTDKANVTEFGSDACNSYEFECTLDTGMYASSVSLNGALYWIAFDGGSHYQFIQSFDFSLERFEFYCALPNGQGSPLNAKSLAVFKGDRLLFLEQNCDTRNIDIWVTKKKIKFGDGKAVEWMNFMNVSVPEWSSLKVISSYPPSFFIDDQSLSLVLCCLNDEEKACIYIAKGDKFDELKVNDLVENEPLHRTYFPSLVQVPTVTMSGKDVESRFTISKEVEVSNGVGGIEWDDGVFDNLRRITVASNDFGVVYVKFYYYKNNVTVAKAGHGNATNHIRTHELLLTKDDYIEAVEGTYTENHITSIAIWSHKTDLSIQCGHFEGKPFVLRGEQGSKIVGFYGKSSDVHVTSLGVHVKKIRKKKKKDHLFVKPLFLCILFIFSLTIIVYCFLV